MKTNHSCYIIAEAGLNHNGSMDLAKRLIDLAAASGANAVKFQKRNVDTLAVGRVLDAADSRFPSFGTTYRQIREALEFSKEEFHELKSRSEKKGLDFICTAFDIPSVDFLEDIGLETYKLASHSITNLPLLKYVASKNKRIIFSAGMCTFDELDQAVDILKHVRKDSVLMHCVSSYPQPPEETNLRLMPLLRHRYALPVGYSGHELGYIPTLAAVCWGAVAVERHFTVNKNLEGFDHQISLSPNELVNMVKDIRTIEKTFGEADKQISETEWETRKKYHVSMVAARAVAPGKTITEEMITYKNPGTGIQPKDASKVLGKKANRQIPADTLIDYSMVD